MVAALVRLPASPLRTTYADLTPHGTLISASNLDNNHARGGRMRRRLSNSSRKRCASHVDTAIIVLQSVGDTWAAEITDGKNASSLLGLVFPPEGRAMSVLHEGTGMIVDFDGPRPDDAHAAVAAFRALYAPLRSRGYRRASSSLRHRSALSSTAPSSPR